jgi:predicted ATPase
VPRQLPAPVSHFTGRTAEPAALSAVLREGQDARVVAIAALAGTAGVGKTAIAPHWAHQAAPDFPDGQLYANLRGYDPGEPARTDEVLARFLRDLGVRGENLPAGEDDLAAAYRSLLAERRVLVVLETPATRIRYGRCCRAALAAPSS